MLHIEKLAFGRNYYIKDREDFSKYFQYYQELVSGGREITYESASRHGEDLELTGLERRRHAIKLLHIQKTKQEYDNNQNNMENTEDNHTDYSEDSDNKGEPDEDEKREILN